jgi:hypothetical protein
VWLVANAEAINATSPVLYPERKGRGQKGGSLLQRFRKLQVAEIDTVVIDLEQPLPLPCCASNIPTQTDVAKDANVVAYAGPKYSFLNVKNPPNGGLGSDGDGVAAIIVPWDTTLCTDATESVTGEPLDGNTAPQLGASSTINRFVDVTFPYAGLFKLCYRKVTDGPWDVMPHLYDVLGAISSSENYWCIYVKDPGLDDWTCRLAIHARGAPADLSWKATLHVYDPAVECGTEFEKGFTLRVADVEEEGDYQVHDFGKREGGVSKEPQLYKVCYCTGFDADNGQKTDNTLEPCSSDHPQDFPQQIGMVVLITGTITSLGKVVTVYPTLRFDIMFECGSAPGGCAGDGGVRYKIVRDSPLNERNYFEESGCRTSPQVDEQLMPFNCANPADCVDQRDENPVSKQFPTFKDVRMDSSLFNLVMIEKDYDVCYCDGNCYSNKNWFKVFDFTVKPVGVAMAFTQAEALLYLGIEQDEDATRRRLERERELEKIEIEGAALPDWMIRQKKRELQTVTAKPPSVNTPAYIVIYGTEEKPDGAWAQESDGSETRELKILPDPNGLVGRDSCLELSQSTLYVSGHVCTEVVDCTPPSYSEPRGQIYGERIESGVASGSIEIRAAGYAAVCYCDRICNEISNWFVAGRLLVAGPSGGQTWVFSVGVAFEMVVEGVALSADNYAMIIDGTMACGQESRTLNVFGPQDNPVIVQGGPDSNPIVRLSSDEFGRGVRIDFLTTHGLIDGDMISLKDIQSRSAEPTGGYEDQMINTAHKVIIICDGMMDGEPCHAIAIPIYFIGAFPDLALVKAIWHRSNLETFRDIRGVVAGTYKVCWSQAGPDTDDSAYVGTAGMLVITEPPLMDAQLAMTAVEPNVGQPVVLSFFTGEAGRYREGEGLRQLKLVFQDSAYLQPLKRDLSPADACSKSLGDCPTVEDRSQTNCGEYILELWSDDPNGFPHPDGCFLRVDETDTTDNGKDLFELYIIFSPSNGLRGEKNYQVVMNALPGPLLSEEEPGNGAVHIWSMEDVYTNPFAVVELGRASANKDMATSLRNEAKGDATFDSDHGFKLVQPLISGQFHEIGRRCANDAPLNKCGICYNEESCGNTDPTAKMCLDSIDRECPSDNLDMASTMFSMAALSGSAIKEKAIVRIFLMPLTQWWIANSCTATCLSHPDTKCGGDQTAEPACAVESVVGGGLVIEESKYHVNTIKITMPEGITPITFVTQHTIKIDGLKVPDGGFLPQATPAELQPVDGEKPHFWPTNRSPLRGS